jgi:hypothetical protein
MKNRNNIKLLVIGLFVLFVGAAVIPGVSSQTGKINNYSKNMRPISRSWSENFDSYTLGQYLNGTSDDGGWKGWDNDSAFGAFVVDIKAKSGPHSVEIVEIVDLVHEFS